MEKNILQTTALYQPCAEQFRLPYVLITPCFTSIYPHRIPSDPSPTENR